MNETDDAREVKEFITNLLNSDADEAHDLLVNYGEDIEAKAADVECRLRGVHLLHRGGDPS